MSRAHDLAQILADGASSPKEHDDALAQLERLADDAERYREALLEIEGVAANPAKPRNALDAILSASHAALEASG